MCLPCHNSSAGSDLRGPSLPNFHRRAPAGGSHGPCRRVGSRLRPSPSAPAADIGSGRRRSRMVSRPGGAATTGTALTRMAAVAGGAGDIARDRQAHLQPTVSAPRSGWRTPSRSSLAWGCSGWLAPHWNSAGASASLSPHTATRRTRDMLRGSRSGRNRPKVRFSRQPTPLSNIDDVVAR